MINEFENSPSMLALKSDLREIFGAILDTIKGAFISFYDWLKNVPIPAPPTVLKMFSNNKANMIIFFAVVIYALYVNVKTYTLFAMDKHYAVRNTERIPEKQLFKYMYLGGACGAALAMTIQRHKTKHMNFVITAAVLVIAQLLLFSFFFGFMGFWAFF